MCTSLSQFGLRLVVACLLLGTAATLTAADVTYGDTFHPDPTFAVHVTMDGGSVNAVAAMADGGFLAGGYFTNIGGVVRRGLAKFKADGTIDSAFNPGNGFNGQVNAIAIQTDGRILVGGSFSWFNGTSRYFLTRLTASGAGDSTFSIGSGFDAPVNVITLQPDGRILVGGGFTTYNGAACNNIARLNTDGTLDTTFRSSPTRSAFLTSSDVSAITVQADGQILIGGGFQQYGTAPWGNMARLSATGTPDQSFMLGNGYGRSLYASYGHIHSIVIQPDGQIVVGGDFNWDFSTTTCYTFARITRDGTLDVNFALKPYSENIIRSIAIQTDGKLITCGKFYFFIDPNNNPNGIARYNINGTLDTTFNPGSGLGGSKIGYGVMTMSDGRMVVCGDFSSFNGAPAGGVVRLLATGALDAEPQGIPSVPGAVITAVPTAGGKILIGGRFNHVNGTTCNSIAQLNADGSLDTAFNPGTGLNPIGGNSIVPEVNALVVQPDGRILVGGEFSQFNGASACSLVRLNADGSRDTTFNTAFTFSDCGVFGIYTLALRPNGRIVAAGSICGLSGGRVAGSINQYIGPYIVELTSSGALYSSFNTGAGFNKPVQVVTLLSYGRTAAGGAFSTFDKTNSNFLAMLDSGGALDTTFHPSITNYSGKDSIYTLAAQPDGRIIAGGDLRWYSGKYYGIARFNTDGTADNNFKIGNGFDGLVTSIALQPDNRILVGGTFDLYGYDQRSRIARLNTDGTLDARFAVSGLLQSAAFQVTPMADGRILVAGPVGTYNGVMQTGVVVLQAGTDVVPYFTTQPRDTSATIGASATLSATATGNPTPTYQWYKDAVPLSGKTGATLTFASASAADAGTYAVLASNSIAYAFSNQVTLTVTAPQPEPKPASGGGGGGGGAINPWALAALTAVVLARGYSRQRQRKMGWA